MASGDHEHADLAHAAHVHATLPGAHTHAEYAGMGALRALADRVALLEGDDRGEAPDWAVGIAGPECWERMQRFPVVRCDDLDALQRLARDGGVVIDLAGGLYEADDAQRGEFVELAPDTYIDCRTLDARFRNVTFTNRSGADHHGGGLIRGVDIDLPDAGDPYRDCISLVYAPLRAFVVANVSLGYAPDEQFTVWGKDSKGGMPREITKYRVHHRRAAPSVGSSNSHGMIVGYQANAPGDASETFITDWECLYETGTRHPLLGDGATVHSVRSIRRRWTGSSVLVRRNGRFKSSGDVWDGERAGRPEATAAVDESRQLGGESIDLEGVTVLGGAEAPVAVGEAVAVRYEYPREAMGAAERTRLLEVVGAG